MPRRIESHTIAGPAGDLEALLEEQEDAAPHTVAVVCHPHPLYGGAMHNKVVYRIARGLRRAGMVVVRFNFRGVGRSQGVHAHVTGEIEDARAALGWLRARYPNLGFALAGFSFGARVVTRLACEIAGARFVLAAGFPTRMGPADYLEVCAVPKIFLQSTHDEFGPRPELDALYARLPEPRQLIYIEAADHFFAGGLEELEEHVVAVARSHTSEADS
ncbi:MAG TPA: alpha/beta fold hydrolase [Candidatus Acidoferrales bacterium]|jgi:alpha/beta superfamily hydrolase|nr:alpha/beta fold hydrolase [Candidatus Acidoferrales bacterium]